MMRECFKPQHTPSRFHLDAPITSLHSVHYTSVEGAAQTITDVGGKLP